MAFSFGFTGADIEASTTNATSAAEPAATAAPTAFPLPNQPQLPPTRHSLGALLSTLPSRIAFDVLDVTLDDGAVLRLPRRALYDVRLQLMAEDEGTDGSSERTGLGPHDVKTGVYEGELKSWESSVDLIKALAKDYHPASLPNRSVWVIELGCGTALLSLSLFHWVLSLEAQKRVSYAFTLADYNPSVLRLVTLPNILLAWALGQRQNHPILEAAFALQDELELSPIMLQLFEEDLMQRDISLSFLSGGWSPDFVELLYQPAIPSVANKSDATPATLLLGAETIYSPFALQEFTDTLLAILRREHSSGDAEARALVAAKKLYFGVGGSLVDFVQRARAEGADVCELREESEGVRRGVVSCSLSKSSRRLSSTPMADGNQSLPQAEQITEAR